MLCVKNQAQEKAKFDNNKRKFKLKFVPIRAKHKTKKENQILSGAI